MKNLLPVAIVFVLLAASVGLFLTVNSEDPVNDTPPVTTTPNLVAQDTKLIVGNANAPVTVVEYFDYKCPSCNNFHRNTGQEIQEAYVDTDQANFEVRITPIIGPDSRRAGLGAYCAKDQNLFPAYHDAVLDYMWDTYYAAGDFSREFTDILSADLLADIASPSGIDTDALKACIESGKHNDKLDQNLELARDDEVRGTPGFAIGEQSFVGGQPFTVFQTLIDIELDS